MNIVRFGVYEVDLRSAELRKHGLRIKLQARPFKVLATLLLGGGEVVTREELRKELWPADTFVDFDHGINSAVNRLREVLCDTADNPRFIETVGRQGYRFIAPFTPLPAEHQAAGVSMSTAAVAVERNQAEPAAAQIAVPSIATHAPPDSVPAFEQSKARAQFGFRQATYFALAVVALVAAGATILKLWPHKTAPVAGQSEIKSIAVLPLRNLSGDPQQDYLSDGLTEAVTTLLAQIADLRVISGTTAMRYKRADKTAPEIAKELGVDALVEGSVVRSGNHLRLSIQLVQTNNDRHIWANSYERELADVVSLEGELSREIAGQIRIRLSPEQAEAFAQKRTVDPEAYALYLQGRYYWRQRNEEALSKSIAYFDQAIARDQKFAPAYAGLADAYLVMPIFRNSLRRNDMGFYEQARIAAKKALELDPRSADARNSEACVRVYRDWDFKGAEQEYQQALALNPNYATAHQWYAELLTMEGRHQEAIVEINRGLELDSQSPVMHHQAGQVLNMAGQYTQAMAEYKRSLELDPGFFFNYFGMYAAYRRMGDYEHAIPLGAVYARSLGKPYQQAFDEAARAFATGGREAFLRKSLRTWDKAGTLGAAMGEAFDYAELHEYERSLQVLEREYKRRNLLVTGMFAPEFDGLRSDPRFQELLHKIGVR
jgi:TolB-like protein/DNA-binding winged helix-turn-helix (wHTH) protein/Flp pilus assembly protein TadD